MMPPPPPPSPYYASSSSSASASSQPQRQRKYDERDYEEIYYHFDDYSQEIILANASKFLTPPEPAEHYEWEEVILDEASESEWEAMKRSACFGMGCGLLGFGLLRWRRDRGGLFRGGLGGGISRYASSSSSATASTSRSAGGYKFDPLPPKSSITNAMHQQQHHHHHHNQYQYANHNTTRSGAIIDTLLSSLLGIGSSLLAYESDIFYPKSTSSSSSNNADENAIEPLPQWISPQIPLVPGRSTISDTLCAPLTEEFRKFPKRLWQSGDKHRGIENGYNNHMALYANSGWKGTKYYEEENGNASIVSLGENGHDNNNHVNGAAGGRGNGGEDGVYERLLLDNLQGFIVNCERRSRHEQRLRKMKGMRNNSNGHMVIPEAGVSADEDLELDDIYLMDFDDDDDDDDDDDEGNTNFGL